MNQISEILIAGKQMIRYYNKKMDELAEELKLSRIEIEIALFLSNNPTFDTARDIAELRMIAKSAVSKGVDGLMKRKYLIGIADKSDRRVIHLKLEKGADEMIRRARQTRQEIFQKLCEGIPKEKLVENLILIQRMADNVKEMETWS